MIRRNLTTRESIGYCKAQVVSQFAVQFFRGRAWALIGGLGLAPTIRRRLPANATKTASNLVASGSD